jgi:hypothetical protein
MTLIVLNGKCGALDVDHPKVVLTTGRQNLVRLVVFADIERMA